MQPFKYKIKYNFLINLLYLSKFLNFKEFIKILIK